ncbi:flavin reductase family protein [Aquibium microcysteis]|uniref:flavin reductase family protein n=1 Tax=Aquibium microcysteis TaxID=675281 RepID=UPI00165D22A0|nr:flavin reductase family protein [Aquibium microcysteis]
MGTEIDIDDTRQLRDAFGRFTTGIVIVTTDVGGERIGATVSSFNSVSLAPPLVSFCIARNARAMAAWETAPGFAVSVLSRTQSHLSTQFARSLGDKWSGVGTRPASCVDAPLIEGALMWFECETYARYDGGDHLIILGRVVAAEAGRSVEPLLFFGGAYRHLAPRMEHEHVSRDDMWLHAW